MQTEQLISQDCYTDNCNSTYADIVESADRLL